MLRPYKILQEMKEIAGKHLLNFAVFRRTSVALPLYTRVVREYSWNTIFVNLGLSLVSN